MQFSWFRHVPVLFLFLSFGTHDLCLGDDSISGNESLSGYQNIISNGGSFVLGFFKPGNSSNAYLGIWYNKVSTQTAVWVANRETPVLDITSSELRISGGNLILFNESSYPIWSTNLNSTNSSLVEAVLRDDGNLVLIDGSKSKSNLSDPLWQSFDHPSDTLLPGARLWRNKKTGKRTILTCWKSNSDPAPGLFSMELDPNGTSQYFMTWNSSKHYWASGLWEEQSKIFQNVPEMRMAYSYNFSYVDIENESYFNYSMYNDTLLSRLTMDSRGQLQMTNWFKATQQMLLNWAQPRLQCDVYAFCGPFGICNNSRPFCQCLKGFDPKDQSDWDGEVFSGGCMRRSRLQCENMRLGKNDRFYANDNVKLPDNNQTVARVSRRECESACLSNCTCTAYAYDNDHCLIWYGEILDLQQLSEGDPNATTLYLRLSASELSKSKTKDRILIIGSAIGTVVVLVLCLLLLRLVIHSRDAVQGTVSFDMSILHDTEKRIKGLIESGDFNEEDKKYIDAHVFDFDSIAAATEYFSDANKLGQGGFGPVYKGRFPGGQEIAIKRLSSVSGQGLEEFKNEVLLIAKLQHRNLVRLLGYCVKGEEKILVYEFMPNKSLDFSIFNKNANVVLNWEERFNIILGVARGMLYLHQDSRLTIVHRDLKASNILLDKEMNPKISDFGLAKIVEGNNIQGNTTRVAGTYGYMSPEYALDGLFSAKSDVFSFGIVVLEILSGKKNTAYFNSDYDLNLLRYAWKLWRRDKPLELMDDTLSQSCNPVEFLKCINVAPLCVQEDPADRPTMSNVVVMLSSEIETFPKPKQPAMFSKDGSNSSAITSVLFSSSRKHIKKNSSREQEVIPLTASFGRDNL